MDWSFTIISHRNLLAHTHTLPLTLALCLSLCSLLYMVHVKNDALPSFTYRSAHLYEMILKKTEKLSIKLHDKNTHILLGTRQSTRTNTLIFSTFFLFVLTAVVTASVSHNICIELQIALRIVCVCVLCGEGGQGLRVCTVCSSNLYVWIVRRRCKVFPIFIHLLFPSLYLTPSLSHTISFSFFQSFIFKWLCSILWDRVYSIWFKVYYVCKNLF